MKNKYRIDNILVFLFPGNLKNLPNQNQLKL